MIIKKELTKISKLNIQGFIHCAINKIVEINPKDIDPDILQGLVVFMSINIKDL